MEFMCFVHNFRTCSSERVETLDVEKKSTETGVPKSVCFTVSSRLIFSFPCFKNEGLTFQRLKFWLNFNIIADFIQNRGECVANFVVSYLGVPSFVALEGMRETGKLSTGTNAGVFSGSQP